VAVFARGHQRRSAEMAAHEQPGGGAARSQLPSQPPNPSGTADAGSQRSTVATMITATAPRAQPAGICVFS
jgi:hypothetical protein